MNELKIIGKIEEFLPIQKGTSKAGKDYEIQEFLVRTDNEYNNLFCFNVFGAEKIANLEKYNKVGDSVSVEFNVRTSGNNPKYYTSLGAWKIQQAEKTLPQPPSESNMPPPITGDNTDVSDDLPFIITLLLGIGSMVSMMI